MTCLQARQQLAAYRRDDWTATEMRALAEHLEQCAACRQIEATYRRVGESLRLLPTLTPDAAFRESVFAAIAIEQRKLGPAAMRASRAETEPSLPVVRAPVTQIPRRRTPPTVLRAAVAIAAVLALALFATQFLPSLDMGGLAANFFRGASTLSPTPTLTSGVFTHPDHAPFPASEFSSTSLYRGWVGSNWVYVYAGETWTNAAAKQGNGALRVYDSQMRLVGVYTAPDASHSVQISRVQGDIVTLTSDTGDTLTFDLATDTFDA